MHPIPPSVRDAINAFEPPEGFVVLRPRRNENSVIFGYGVRLVKAPQEPFADPDPSSPAIWMCLARESCHENDISFPLSTGRRSAATKHLKKAHDIVSDKTEVVQDRKRSREDELNRVRNSHVFRDDPSRIYVLMETLRIVNNNLPYRLGEYEEPINIRELVFKDSMQATINAKVVCHSIAELYPSTKRSLEEILHVVRIGNAATFTAVADFWSSKVQNVKYLGLRLYMVDKNFKFKSILLGTRHFVPHYNEREGGIRRPFKRWITGILRNFGLTTRDLYGSTSDGGSDVKWMMTTGLKLSWQCCIPHMTNATTKAACGMVADTTTSKNPAFTQLIRRIVKAVYTVKHVKVMGSLFEELCLFGKSSKSPHQLLEYRTHRFLALTRVIQRILLLWEHLVTWYAKRFDRVRRNNDKLPAGFPLERDYQTLTQILSLLQPITLVNIKVQSESATQVDVLLTLYKLWITVLDSSKELKDYRSTKDRRMDFRPEDLTELASNTRVLLQEANVALSQARVVAEAHAAQQAQVSDLLVAEAFKQFEAQLHASIEEQIRGLLTAHMDQVAAAIWIGIAQQGQEIMAHVKHVLEDFQQLTTAQVGQAKSCAERKAETIVRRHYAEEYKAHEEIKTSLLQLIEESKSSAVKIAAQRAEEMVKSLNPQLGGPLTTYSPTNTLVSAIPLLGEGDEESTSSED